MSITKEEIRGQLFAHHRDKQRDAIIFVLMPRVKRWATQLLIQTIGWPRRDLKDECVACGNLCLVEKADASLNLSFEDEQRLYSWLSAAIWTAMRDGMHDERHLVKRETLKKRRYRAKRDGRLSTNYDGLGIGEKYCLFSQLSTVAESCSDLLRRIPAPEDSTGWMPPPDAHEDLSPIFVRLPLREGHEFHSTDTETTVTEVNITVASLGSRTLRVLHKHRWNVTRAAKELKMPRTTLRDRKPQIASELLGILPPHIAALMTGDLGNQENLADSFDNSAA